MECYVVGHDNVVTLDPIELVFHPLKTFLRKAEFWQTGCRVCCLAFCTVAALLGGVVFVGETGIAPGSRLRGHRPRIRASKFDRLSAEACPGFPAGKAPKFV
jgi:hypothetical protein